AVIAAARAVTCGEGDLYIAGGVESMSRAPFVFAKAEMPFSRDMKVFDTTMGTRFPNPRFIEAFGGHTMAETADAVASELNISRAASDAFALASQRKYAAAKAAGFFGEEINPAAVPATGRSDATIVGADEHPRPETDAAALARLKPLQSGGVVTAGN